ncbi:MAG TPA: hypothetical protein VMS08_06130 [Candidatus Saccharimonadia bacterium]|nr:hypothetical protein [Candidatus Saccharimonadia bacterium]
MSRRRDIDARKASRQDVNPSSKRLRIKGVEVGMNGHSREILVEHFVAERIYLHKLNRLISSPTA